MEWSKAAWVVSGVVVAIGLGLVVVRASFAAKLHADFMNLSETRGANGLAIRETAAIGVDRQPAADLSDTICQPLLLITVCAKTVFRHVHDFGADFGVLQLRNINIFRSDAGQFKSGLRGSDRGRVRDLWRLRRTKDLEATVVS